jgi:aryl-alcohol dehydrogenase-like predicted oxidoreductase
VGLQPRYNLFVRDIEQELLPACGKMGLGVMVYSPLCQGLLTGKYRMAIPKGSRADLRRDFNRFLTAYNQQAVEVLSALAHNAGITLAQMSLAWILRMKSISAAIVGASHPDQLSELVKASGMELPDSLVQDIQKALDQRRALILDEDAKALRQIT